MESCTVLPPIHQLILLVIQDWKLCPRSVTLFIVWSSLLTFTIYLAWWSVREQLQSNIVLLPRLMLIKPVWHLWDQDKISWWVAYTMCSWLLLMISLFSLFLLWLPLKKMCSNFCCLTSILPLHLFYFDYFLYFNFHLLLFSLFTFSTLSTCKNVAFSWSLIFFTLVLLAIFEYLFHGFLKRS